MSKITHTIVCRMAWLRRKLLCDWLGLTLWAVCGWLCKETNKSINRMIAERLQCNLRVCWVCWPTDADDDWIGVDWLLTGCTGSCPVCCWAGWFCGVVMFVACGWGVKSSCELTCGDIIGTCSLFDWFSFDNLLCESRKFCFDSVGLRFVTAIRNEWKRKLNINLVKSIQIFVCTESKRNMNGTCPARICSCLSFIAGDLNVAIWLHCTVV